MTHVELVWVSFGRLLLQLLISEPQEVKEGARGGRWFQEMNPDPGNRATPPLGHTGLKGFLEVGNAHDSRSFRLGWPNITTFRLQRMNSVPCLQTPHLRLVWFLITFEMEVKEQYYFSCERMSLLHFKRFLLVEHKCKY